LAPAEEYQVEIEHAPTTKMKSDLRGTEHEGRKANEREERSSERCVAREVKEGEVAGAGPLHQASPPRATGRESEHERGVNEDSPLQHEKGSQEKCEGEQQRRPQQMSPRGEALTSRRGMSETPITAESPFTPRANARDETARSNTTVGPNQRGRVVPGGQGVRREVFQVGVKGQQHTQAQIKCVACGLWVARLSVDTYRSFFACNTRCVRRWQLEQLRARTQCNGGL
jgi:hypothetical protein